MGALKFFDFFGENFHLYINKNLKYYNNLGGIFFILLIVVCIVAFSFLGLDDFQRNTPITSSSNIFSTNYKKIKFGENKIWLPWRIINYDESNIEHKNIIYPIINYYYGEKEEDNIKLNHKVLNYKLCNETSMKTSGESKYINVPLDKVYCIDMDDIFLGGSWISEFIYYIQFDFYVCKNGISYEPTNPDCTTFEKLKEIMGKDNYWYFDLYYPVVQFQPANINNPLGIVYRNYFYSFSKYNIKIDRIYLKENILEDDLGWLIPNKKNLTRWGLSEFTSENYLRTNDDLITEGSNSRIYSLNIYLDEGIIFYKRTYKKILTILSEVFPILNFILLIFQEIICIIKNAMISRKLIEYIFERNVKSEHKSYLPNLTKSHLNINNERSLNFSNICSEIVVSKKMHSEDGLKCNNSLLNINHLKGNNEITDNQNINQKDDLKGNNNISYNRKYIKRNKNSLLLFTNNASKGRNILFRKKNKTNKPETHLFKISTLIIRNFIRSNEINLYKKLFEKDYIIVNNYLSSILDVKTYINCIRYLQNLILKLNDIKDLYTDDQNNFFKKLNLNNKELMKELEDINN